MATVFAAAAAVAGVFVLVTMVATDLWGAAVGRPFDAQVWRDQGNEPPALRAAPRDAMVKDLIESKQLDGMTRSEVIDLLGEPIFFPSTSLEDADQYAYVLGSGIIDAWVFSVSFGADGRVTSYRRFNG